MLKKHTSKGTFGVIFEDISKYNIEPFLNLKECATLLRISKGINTLFRESFEDRVQLKLLQSVIDDNQKEVEKILEAMPHLLLKKPKIGLHIVSQLTGQTFIPEKPLKMAAKRGQLDMVELILPYFNKIKDTNGKHEALKQLDTCVTSKKVEQEEQYKEKMNKLIKEIKKETFSKRTETNRLIDQINDNTKKILEDFKNELIPNAPITLDTYFDLNALLLASFTAYKEQEDNHDWMDSIHSWNQRSLYCIAIIGFIQTILSPYLAKVFCEGLYELEMTSAVFRRKPTFSTVACSFQLKNAEKGISIYRSTPDLTTRAGIDFFVNALASHHNTVRDWAFPHGYYEIKSHVGYIQSRLMKISEDLRQAIYPNQIQINVTNQ